MPVAARGGLAVDGLRAGDGGGAGRGVRRDGGGRAAVALLALPLRHHGLLRGDGHPAPAGGVRAAVRPVLLHLGAEHVPAAHRVRPVQPQRRDVGHAGGEEGPVQEGISRLLVAVYGVQTRMSLHVRV